jgi:hypothetical protein
VFLIGKKIANYLANIERKPENKNFTRKRQVQTKKMLSFFNDVSLFLPKPRVGKGAFLSGCTGAEVPFPLSFMLALRLKK